MKREIMAGILGMAVLLLSACGTGDDAGEAVSLEPHSLEADNVIGASGMNGGSDSASGINGGSGSAAGENGGSDSAAGVNGGSGSASGVNGGSDSASGISGGAGSAASGTGGTGSAGKRNGASGSGNAEDGSGQGTGASAVGAGSEQSAPASGAGTQGSSGTYKDIYTQKVNENESTAKIYSLIYLDVDEIPELVISMGDGIYSIYTVKDNELFCMADSVGTVELTYFERSGVIAAFSRWNGGGDEGGYGSYYYQMSKDRTLTDDDEAVLSYSYNATYDEKGVYMGTGVTDYFYMGQKIDEAAYQEKIRSLGIAEGEDRLCMENSYSKEEIIALFNR